MAEHALTSYQYHIYTLQTPLPTHTHNNRMWKQPIAASVFIWWIVPFWIVLHPKQLLQTNRSTAVCQCYWLICFMGRPVDRAWLRQIWRLVSTVHSQPANHLDIVSCLYWRLWLPSVSQLTDNPLQGLWPHRGVGTDWHKQEKLKQQRGGDRQCKKSKEGKTEFWVAVVIAVVKIETNYIRGSGRRWKCKRQERTSRQ